MIARRRSLAELGPHGHPMDEAMSPMASPANPDRQWRYRAVGPAIDYAQAEIDRAIEERRKARPEEQTSAHHWRVVREDID